MLNDMRWLNPSLRGAPFSRPWRVVVACCIALFALAAAPHAQAQSAPDDSEWFDDSSQEPTYWSGAPPAPEAPAPPDDAAYAADEGQPPPGDATDEQTRNQRAVEEFSPHLAPYGVWVDDGMYGRVWVPNTRYVGPSFAPYVSGGHWELTVNDDWLWVSDYPFGWVAFHYGRWVWLPSARWGWVPGYRWAPAWVDFRVASPGVAYVGWGPSRPTYIWRHGLFVSFTTAVSVPYVFCPSASVFSVSVNRYVVRDRYRVRELSRETRVYRTRRVHAGVAVHAPSVHEARIPERYVPRQRVIGRPQSISQRSSYDRRYLSSPGARRSYGEQRSNAGAGRPSPGYAQPGRDRGRDGFQRLDGAARPPAWTPQNRTPQNQNRQRAPAGAAPARNRTYTPSSQRQPHGYSAPPAQRSIAPRVDDRYRATRRHDGNHHSGEGSNRPPPASFQRRESAAARTTAPARRPRPQRADSNNDNGSSSRAHPTSRERGESSRH